MEPDEPIDEYEPAPTHTWRHVRTAVTLLVLVGFVIGAAWYSWDNVMNPGDDDDVAGSPTMCPTGAPTDAPAPEEIELNVYNATGRNGLAQQVASQMSDRGFIILDVANDPQDSTIEGTAEIRSHPDRENAAGLVASMVPDAELVADERDSDAVDLVLGDSFEELTAPEPDSMPTDCG